jgi:hypothetical protein
MSREVALESLGRGESLVVDLDGFMERDAREGGCSCPICEKLRAAYAAGARGDVLLSVGDAET